MKRRASSGKCLVRVIHSSYSTPPSPPQLTPNKRYCPSRWILPKVKSLDRSSLKREAWRFSADSACLFSVRALQSLPAPPLLFDWQFGTQLATALLCGFAFRSCKDWQKCNEQTWNLLQKRGKLLFEHLLTVFNRKRHK